MKRLSNPLYLPELSGTELCYIAKAVTKQSFLSKQGYIDDLEKLNVRCADRWLMGFDDNIVQKCIKEIYTKEFEDWFNNNSDTKINGHLAGVPKLTAWHDAKKYALDAWLASRGL